MPYTTSTKIVKGKKKFCMTSKDTGKTYCYASAKKRKAGMKQHEMFKSMKAAGTLRSSNVSRAMKGLNK